MTTIVSFAALCTLVAAAAPLPDEPVPDRRADAVALVAAMAGGAPDAAAARFDEAMRVALPPGVLASTWAQLQAQGGAFRGIGAARQEAAGGFTAVFVPCRFERAELVAKVMFNVAGKVAGLFFLPATPLAAAWTPPPYATQPVEEIDVTIGTTWPLAGVLTLPKARSATLPAVVLVHGSGPQDKDETVGPNKPFRDLALGLAAHGIAVLRYDKRTHVHAARLVTELKTFTLNDETVDDAVLAAELLAKRDEVDPKRIVVVGHSLGGNLAPRIAGRLVHKAGVVILAGNTRPLGDVVVEQLTTSALLDKAIDAREQAQIDNAKAFQQAMANPDLAPSARVDLLGVKLPGSYVIDLQRYDPVRTAAELQVPILIMQGGRDYQVTDADYQGWQRGLSAKKTVTFLRLPALNHLFIAGTGPATPAEYDVAGHVDESAVAAIATFVLAR